MSLIDFARSHPDKPAVIMCDDGQSISFAELDRKSALFARQLRNGLNEGDRVAILLDNSISYYIAAWAARRAGLRYVPINWHLHRQETAYIVDNSDARALISSKKMQDIAEYAAERGPSVEACYSMDDAFGSFRAVDDENSFPPIVEREGTPMFYSSGTTGTPKGILRDLPGAPFGDLARIEELMAEEYGFGPQTVYLSPAPLYHAAPLTWSMGTQALGGTAIVMNRFDAESALAAIERYRVTHAQFVPTHLIRMLKLPDAVRARYDVSSMTVAIHAAAPCPPEVKERMIAWWGPVIEEYYGASEGGFTRASSAEWLERPGTVGLPRLGPIHILGDDGRELPAGEVGTIFFEGSGTFSFHKEPEKTREHIDPRGWCAPGDLGYVDKDGYLFLADRKSNMIISGGVNIYPQEVENLLTMHPEVADIAVIGIPHPEFGEEVKAVVVPAAPVTQPEALEARLIAYCREQLAHFKCPRSVDFVDNLPRLPTGKLRKRDLMKRYSG